MIAVGSERVPRPGRAGRSSDRRSRTHRLPLPTRSDTMRGRPVSVAALVSADRGEGRSESPPAASAPATRCVSSLANCGPDGAWRSRPAIVVRRVRPAPMLRTARSGGAPPAPAWLLLLGELSSATSGSLTVALRAAAAELRGTGLLVRHEREQAPTGSSSTAACRGVATLLLNAGSRRAAACSRRLLERRADAAMSPSR